MDAENAIEQLTGLRINLDEARGRNVWIAVSFKRDGMIHVQIAPTDRIVNDQVMPTIKQADFPGADDRRTAYRKRCVESAGAMNAKIIADNKLFLFLASNGHLTKEAKAVIDVLL